MLNTLFVACTVTGIKVFLDSMAGYALAKLEFTGKRLVFLLMLILLMVPFGVILIPLWSIAHELDITNTYLALILPPLANPLGVFLMRQFILAPAEATSRTPPGSTGVSEFGIYWRIILPLVKPGLVVLAVIVFTDQFMSFIWPLVATPSDDLLVLTSRRGRAAGQGRRQLRALVGGGGHVAGPHRGLLLRPAAPVPGTIAGRGAEAMSRCRDRQPGTGAGDRIRDRARWACPSVTAISPRLQEIDLDIDAGRVRRAARARRAAARARC